MSDSVVKRPEAKVAVRERRQYRRELYDITSNSDLTFEEKLQALFELGRELFDLDFGAMARVDPGADRFEVEHVSDEDAPFEPGIELPLPETYCTAAMEVEDAAGVVDPAEAGYDTSSSTGSSGCERTSAPTSRSRTAPIERSSLRPRTCATNRSRRTTTLSRS
ncbi:hypothetical protein BRC81_11165 [Halobacteriales archaeon QS_1_68_20]|nr:MAG: hypothetical protein BRC81_11165 [Halobacteriales archaeon QS_1_68_20]